MDQPNQEGFVQVPGGKIWFQVVGEGEGLPLITLHGGPGSTHFGLEPLGALGKDRTVVFYDQLGCGNSDRPEDPGLWRMERFVEELFLLVKALDFQEFHILGHSWGTMLGVDYYFGHPAGITSLILSSPCLSVKRWLEDCNRLRQQLPADTQAALNRHEEAGTTDSEEYQQAALEFRKRHVLRLDPVPEAVAEGRRQRGTAVYHAMWGPQEFSVDGNLLNYERAEDLASINLPTLYSCGRFDEAAPETVQWYSSQTPGSECHVYENSAHMPHWEETAGYLKVVSDFLHRAEEGTPST